MSRSDALSLDGAPLEQRAEPLLRGRFTSPFAEVACPSCFARFHLAAAPFRCAAEPVVCAPEGDTLLGRFLGLAEAPQLGRVVQPGGGVPSRLLGRIAPPRRAQCDACGTTTDKRLCPACHATLPRSLGRADFLPVPVIGAPASGKSTLIAGAAARIEGGAGAPWRLAAWPDGDDIARRLRNAYRDPLFVTKRVLPRSNSIADDPGLRHPLAFRVETPGLASLLGLYDTAGGDFADDAGTERYAAVLREAAALILVVDPRDLPAFGGRIEDAARPALRVLNLLETLGRAAPGGRVDLPTAVVLAKLDRVADRLPDGVEMLRPVEVPGGASSEVAAFLAAWGAGGLTALMRAKFADCAFFAASALGDEPRGDSVEGAVPFRAEEPLLWLLARLGRFPLT
ncbi:MAG: hypothetical protein FJX47_18705 [Alphaproteobacteria bacterium]|nr:hypothetical protein [Alphaproteobacteria bacterium]